MTSLAFNLTLFCVYIFLRELHFEGINNTIQYNIERLWENIIFCKFMKNILV